MTDIRCVICESTSLAKVRYTTELSYLHCMSCGHYLLRVPHTDDLQSYFNQQQEKYFHTDPIFLTEAIAEIEAEPVRRRLSIIRRHLPPRSYVLEVGPGSGATLQSLRNSGHQVDAVEESTVLANRLSGDHGGDIFISNLESASLLRTYDAVLTFHVIEHAPMLDLHFNKMASLLKPGALIFVATPNSRSLQNRLPFRLSPNFDSSHLHIFSKLSVQKVLNRHGFEILEYSTPEYPTGWIRVFTKILRRLLKRNEQSTAGNFVRTASNTKFALRLCLRTFAILSWPLRKTQELLTLGNEIIIVAKKRPIES